jgi:hypothetical protein
MGWKLSAQYCLQLLLRALPWPGNWLHSIASDKGVSHFWLASLLACKKLSSLPYLLESFFYMHSDLIVHFFTNASAFGVSINSFFFTPALFSALVQAKGVTGLERSRTWPTIHLYRSTCWNPLQTSYSLCMQSRCQSSSRTEALRKKKQTWGRRTPTSSHNETRVQTLTTSLSWYKLYYNQLPDNTWF